MDLRALLDRVASSSVADWQILFRPTFRYRLTEIRGANDAVEGLELDEHRVAFSFKPDVAVTMAFGMVEQGAFELPPDHPFRNENARSSYLDIFLEGRLIHREVVLSVDRQRCLLPMPRAWGPPTEIAPMQYRLVRLVHDLAGPPTDYENYFIEAGMVQATVPWP